MIESISHLSKDQTNDDAERELELLSTRPVCSHAPPTPKELWGSTPPLGLEIGPWANREKKKAWQPASDLLEMPAARVPASDSWLVQPVKPLIPLEPLPAAALHGIYRSGNWELALRAATEGLSLTLERDPTRDIVGLKAVAAKLDGKVVGYLDPEASPYVVKYLERGRALSARPVGLPIRDLAGMLEVELLADAE